MTEFADLRSTPIGKWRTDYRPAAQGTSVINTGRSLWPSQGHPERRYIGWYWHVWDDNSDGRRETLTDGWTLTQRRARKLAERAAANIHQRRLAVVLAAADAKVTHLFPRRRPR